VRVRTEASTSERMHAYRKLIGAACGGVPPAEVDAYVGMLLEVRPACAPSVCALADALHHRRSSRRSRRARRRWRGAARPRRRRRRGHERGGAVTDAQTFLFISWVMYRALANDAMSSFSLCVHY
jgi:hypothetical protein